MTLSSWTRTPRVSSRPRRLGRRVAADQVEALADGGRLPTQVVPKERCPPGVGGEDGRQDGEEGRLAGPVRPHDAVDGPGSDAEGDASKRLAAARPKPPRHEGLCESLRLHHPHGMPPLDFRAYSKCGGFSMRGGPGEARGKKNLAGKGRWDVALGGTPHRTFPAWDAALGREGSTRYIPMPRGRGGCSRPSPGHRPGSRRLRRPPDVDRAFWPGPDGPRNPSRPAPGTVPQILACLLPSSNPSAQARPGPPGSPLTTPRLPPPSRPGCAGHRSPRSPPRPRPPA